RRAVEEELEAGRVQLVANHHMRAQAMTAPGFALVGEAGGCAHPLTAAGMTVCLRDVRLVAGALDRAGGLGRFAPARRPFVRSRELLARALYQVFSGADIVSQRLREGMFRYWRDPGARG